MARNVKIKNFCRICHEPFELEMPEDRFEIWVKGKAAKDAFPAFTPVQCEMLTRNKCAKCAEKK